MAITKTDIDSGSDTSTGDTATTSSVTPTANRLQLLSVVGHPVGANATPTVTGCGLTWVQVEHNSFDGAGSGDGLTVFRALGASPTTGALTIDFAAAQVTILWAWSEFAGVNTTGTNGSGAVINSAQAAGTGLTSTVTLGAFSSVNNGTYGASVVADTGRTSTAGSGFTEIHEVAEVVAGTTLQTEWRTSNDTTVDNTWSGAGTPAKNSSAPWAVTGCTQPC